MKTAMTTLARVSLAALAAAATTAAFAAPEQYDVDPNHTFPSFEADHMGISLWRGKINQTEGTVMLDKGTGTGTVDLTIDLSSIDFGQEQLNRWAQGKDFFETSKYPRATYKGKLEGFGKGTPRVTGELTLHGVTKPVALQVNSFKCIAHPMFKRDYCGADALATFNRADFGLTAGKDYGFDMKVTLRIQVEALKAQTPAKSS